MASQVEICNRAATKLGASRITSLSENSKTARALSSVYETVRKAELAKNHWNFALARRSLAALGATPDWGFVYQYQLPTDFLKITQVHDIFVAPGLVDYRQEDDSAYAIEGSMILTDFGAPLKIRYVRDITDPAAFDPLFVEMLAAKMAYEVCYEITQSRQGQDQAVNDYNMAAKSARLANAIARPPQGIADDAWVLGRI
jgi:hypothetical protein